MRAIQITGKSSIKVRPDVMALRITLSGTEKQYSEALKASSNAINALNQTLMPFGFDKKDIKTVSFDVSPKKESRITLGKRRTRLIGYSYEHVVRIEFDFDNQKLGKILYALSKMEMKPDFDLIYTVKDPESVKKELIVQAVQDARDKAESISQAAGVTLKGIQSIDYSWKQLNLEARIQNLFVVSGNYEADDDDEECEEEYRGYDMGIEPADLKAEDTITVIWEIG